MFVDKAFGAGVHSMVHKDTHKILQKVRATETLPARTERNGKSTEQKKFVRIPKFSMEESGW